VWYTMRALSGMPPKFHYILVFCVVTVKRRNTFAVDVNILIYGQASI